MSGNPNKRAPESPKGSQKKKSRKYGLDAQLEHTTVDGGWIQLTADFKEDKRLADLAKNAALKNITIYYHTPETKTGRNRVGHYGMYSIKFTIAQGKTYYKVAMGHGKTMQEAVLDCENGLVAYYEKGVTDNLLKDIQENQQKWYELKKDFEDPQLADLAKKVAGERGFENVGIFYQITPEQLYPEDPSVPDGKQTKSLKWCTIKFTKRGEEQIVAIGPGTTMKDAALACRADLEAAYTKEIVNGWFSHM